MSSCYTASVVIGFSNPASFVFAKLLKKRKEKSHSEKRYDQKTGKPYKIKVVDQLADAVWILQGEEFKTCPDDDDLESLAEGIATAVECEYGVDYNFDSDDRVFQATVSFYPKGCRASGEIGDPDELPLSAVTSNTKKLKTLKKRLEALGVQCDEPTINVIAARY